MVRAVEQRNGVKRGYLSEVRACGMGTGLEKVLKVSS